MTARTLKITKLDAARRQLELAIVLYFHKGDPVSIHTLTAAAYDVLRGVNLDKGGQPMIKDWVFEMIKPEHISEFRQTLGSAQNFFKHADRDPDATLEFVPQQTEFLLLDAAWTLHRLIPERVPVVAIFELWGFLTFGSTFVTYAGQDKTDGATRLRLASLSRQEFFEEMLPVAYRAQIELPDA